MEADLLKALKKAATGVKLAAPEDLRASLKRNARAKKWKTRDVGALEGMVWHQELGWGSVEDVARYHTGKESHLAAGGVESIAYSFAIRRSGQVVLCNPLDRAVWSQGYKGRPGDENAEFLSVMFEGLFTGPGVNDPSAGAPTAAQLLAGLLLWRVGKDAWGWPDDALYGHYHFGKPACPGDVLQGVIEAVRANAAASKYDFGTVEGRQQALKDLGFNRGVVDGVWGPQSRGALVAFQAEHDLAADGVWGPASEAAVRVALG